MQGAPATSVRLLTSGRMEVGSHDEDGNYCLLAIRGSGDVVGEMAAHIEGLRSATVTALEQCTAYSVPVSTFRAVLARHGMGDQLSRYMAAKLQEAGRAAVDTVRLPPMRRLARLVVRLVDLADPSCVAPLQVPMSQTRMAEALGLSRSLVAQLVSALRVDGLLGDGRALVVEQPTRLRTMAGLPPRQVK